MPRARRPKKRVAQTQTERVGPPPVKLPEEVHRWAKLWRNPDKAAYAYHFIRYLEGYTPEPPAKPEGLSEAVAAQVRDYLLTEARIAALITQHKQ